MHVIIFLFCFDQIVCLYQLVFYCILMNNAFVADCGFWNFRRRPELHEHSAPPA